MIAPSLAAVPMAHLADTVAKLEQAGVDMLHFDLEDGHFVPVMTLGTRLIGELRPLTQLPFDVHLMVSNPESIIPEVARLGANSIACHYEATPYPRRTLRQIKRLGKKAGLAFNPKTLLPDLDYLLACLDYVVVLTTEPEFPDCPFLPAVLSKVQAIAAFAQVRRPQLDIMVDGGIDASNAAIAVAAGATTLVSGRGIFYQDRIMENVQRLRAAAEGKR